MNHFKFILPLVALLSLSAVVQCSATDGDDNESLGLAINNDSSSSSTRTVNTKALLAQTQTTASFSRRNNASSIRQGSALLISILAGCAFLTI